MADFVRLAAVAKRLVEANGRLVQGYRRATTPADGAKPWRGTAAAATGTPAALPICFVPPGGGGLGFVQSVDGTLDPATEQIGLLAAESVPAGVDALLLSSIVDGGAAWRVLRVDQLKPADVALLFVLQLAR